MQTVFYIILAVLGLNILVFIHELGHYCVARYYGMRIEVFSIGFGKPLFSWNRHGVKWQICPIFFGGYVRIAGMEKEGDLEPYEVPEGFYSKSPWKRIQVAIAGPVVNVLCALLVFTLIWAFGGREKPFSDFTQLIGSVEQNSPLFEKGVRPGDKILKYNLRPFQGYQDLVYTSISAGDSIAIQGDKIDYFTGSQDSFDYRLNAYQDHRLSGNMKTIGINSLASYLIYTSPGYKNLPITHSGIQVNDRIIWMNGHLLFSNYQLSSLLNNDSVFLTVEREGKIFSLNVPSFPIEDLRLTMGHREELKDWIYEAGLLKQQQSLMFIPYNISGDMRIEGYVHYINERSEISDGVSSNKEINGAQILQEGDKIVSLYGEQVNDPITFLKRIQHPQSCMIVYRSQDSNQLKTWDHADQEFISGIEWKNMLPIIQSVGTKNPVLSKGSFHLLQPVSPIRLKDFPMTDEESSRFQERVADQQAAVEKISDVEAKEVAMHELGKFQNRWILGVGISDQMVIYNPNPLVLLGSVFSEIVRNLQGLFSGSLGPKQFGGPLFIVQVMQHSWHLGFQEALFWLGAISLNLGVINLLPIPVLDGGHICFSIIEMIRKKPMTAKMMQRFVVPFVILIFGLFIYMTYNDLLRIFG